MDQRFRDKLWRLQNLYRIRTKERGLTKLTFNEAQRRILNEILPSVRAGKAIRHYDLKARQRGVSTFWVLWYLDDAIFHSNTVNGILAQERETLDHLWDIAKIAHANMPEAVRPEIIKDNAKTMAFHNNSKFFVSLNIQSTVLHSLHVSEYPLCDPIDIGETIAAVPRYGNITLEGVAKGFNHARDKWREKDDGYSRLFHAWYLQEDYRLSVPQNIKVVRSPDEVRLTQYVKHHYGFELHDEQILYRRYRQKELKNMFQEQMAEDPESCFLSSGNPFFDTHKIATLIKEAEIFIAERPPVEQTEEYTMYEKPERGCVYAAGADTAEGLVVGDWSYMAIINVTRKTTAFRYRARVPTGKFYHVLDHFGRMYNKALLAPELNNTGHAVIQGLQELSYPNLFFEDHLRHVTFGKKEPEKTRKYGWETTAKSRSIALEGIKQAIEGEYGSGPEDFDTEFIVLDNIFLDECLTFHNEDGKIEAAPGKHDDGIFAWAIAYQMFKRLVGKNISPSSGILLGGQSEASRTFG
jgi:hypothetical protein